MLAIRVVVLCLACALVCAALRVHRPEIAAAVALAAGVTALLMTVEAFSSVTEGVRRFIALAAMEGETAAIVLRAAGITIISELGGQLCCDAGESALAGRIRLAVRVVMLAIAMPVIIQITDAVGALLG